MLLPILLASVPILVILVASQRLWNNKQLRGERARKFVHILAGTFIAFWPFFLDWELIQLLSLLLLVVTALSYRFNIFKAIHGVERRTWGEMLFALAIGVVALLAPNRAIFCAAVLHLALADGVAALVGGKYGRKNSYMVFNLAKSIAGTMAFYGISVVIISIVVFANYDMYEETAFAVLLWIPALAALLENISPRGLDNMIVPMFVGGALYSFQAV